MHNEYLERYSGVILNQNGRPGPSDHFNPTDPFVQEFVLPANHARVGEIPPLSGFQVLVGVTDAEAFSCTWSVEYQSSGVGWIPIGDATTTTGAQREGDRVWVDLIAGGPITVSEDMLARRFRVRFDFAAGIDRVWYTTPNPLASSFTSAYEEDGSTALVSGDESICFRVLALVADEGVDFLGNNYRSMIRSATSQNVNPITGVPDSIWMSKPNPSRFAIENLYFDMRPHLGDPLYGGVVNEVFNPRAAFNTNGWSIAGSGGETLARNDALQTLAGLPAGVTTAFRGTTDADSNDVRWHYTNVPVTAGETLTFSAYVRIPVGLGGARMALAIFRPGFVDGAGTGYLTTEGGDWQRISCSFTAVADETLMVYVENRLVVNSTLEWTAVQVHREAAQIPYADGDFHGHVWSGAQHASVTRELIEQGVSDATKVVDRVMVDPVTPGVYFNVYHTSEGDPGVDEADWENKLWSRVPQTFRADKKETHVFPRPIEAKYIKIEFSHLQAKHYNAGDFARPVKYKKHPKWVLDYFMARVEAHRAVENDLISGRVGIVYDAMDLAYNYYLDDLRAAPETLPETPTDITNFLNDRADLSDQIDPIMLQKIRLAMSPYTEHFINWAKPDYLLGALILDETDRQNAPVERATIPIPEVGELRNDQVVFEQSFPVMFFYLTSRHKYREVVAPLDRDRAYFVGIREIAFTREHYATQYDNNEYIEPGGDLLNIERNDFESQDGVMVI